MLELNFSPFPEMETERLILRNLVKEDVQDVLNFRGDPETMLYIPRPVAQNLEDAAMVIDMMTGFTANNEKINWAVIEKSSQKLIGTFGYVRFQYESYRGEVGYILNKNYHGMGYAQEALVPILKYGFGKMGLHSIEAVIRAENTASMKLVEKFGFTKDAYFKDYIYHNDQYWDAVVYSLVNSEK